MPRSNRFRPFTFEALEARQAFSVDTITVLPNHDIVAACEQAAASDLENSSAPSQLVTAKVCSWLHQYVPPTVLESMPNAVPELLILAMRHMNLRSTTHERDVPGNLFQRMIDNPQTAYWAGGGSTSDALIQAIQAFGLEAHRVNLWHTMTDSHVALEYESMAFGKPVFYDPQYGVLLLNDLGEPASVRDMLQEYSGHGLDFANWSYRPVRIFSFEGNEAIVAADPRNAYFQARNYEQILRYYFGLISVAFEDYTPQSTQLPGELIARGRWTVYNQLELVQGLSPTKERELITAFASRYGTESGGRYYLTGYRQTMGTLLPPTRPFDLAQSLELFVQRLQAGPTAPHQDLWQQWLSHYADSDAPALSAETAPELLFRSMRTMYLQATTHETDVNGNLLRLALENSGTPYWANCGSSSEFIIDGLRSFGIPAHRISLWNKPGWVGEGFSHEAIEYFSLLHGKYVFYDPLFAITFRNASGVPGSVRDLQAQIDEFGFDSTRWRFQPKQTEPFSQVSSEPADPRFVEYNDTNYHEIVRLYFRFLAVRYEDSTADREFLPGSTFAKGKWTIYDQTKFSTLYSATENIMQRDILFAGYSAEIGGRYYLDFFEIELFTTAPVETETPFENYQSRLSNGIGESSADLPALQSWLTRYLPSGAIFDNTEIRPEFILIAQRMMFLNATIHERDVAGNLYDLVVGQPQVDHFAGSGSTVDFLLRTLTAFGTSARRVLLWHTPTATHTALEYFSPTFSKYAYYDPSYGVLMLDAAGIPASVDDLLNELAVHGLNTPHWRFQPTRLNGFDNLPSTAPADSRYRFQNERDYSEILKAYFHFVAVEFEAAAKKASSPPPADISIRGKWLIYDNTVIDSRLSAETRSLYRNQIDLRYSLAHGGRYDLTWYVQRFRQTTLDTSKADGSPDVEGFFSTIQRTSDTSAIQHLELWRRTFLGSTATDLQSNTLPEQLIGAMNRMYLSATHRDTDLGVELFDLVQQNPTAAYWGGGSSSANFLIRTFQEYGIPVNRVLLWASPAANSSAIEYYSSAFGKMVFYDPLYRVMFLNKSGVPASVDDLLREVSQHGRGLAYWEYLPVRMSGYDSDARTLAADERYSIYNNRPYSDIVGTYLKLISVGFDDRTPTQTFLPGETVARGRWTVYEQSHLTANFTVEQREQLLEQFISRYSAQQQGRYYLSTFSRM